MDKTPKLYGGRGDLDSPARPLDWDRSAALKSVGEDEDLLMEVIQSFLLESPKMIVEMEKALLLLDPRMIEFAAHNLRGALGYLGVPEAYEEAEEIETAGRTGEIGGTADLFSCLRMRLAALCNALSQNHGSGADEERTSRGITSE